MHVCTHRKTLNHYRRYITVQRQQRDPVFYSHKVEVIDGIWTTRQSGPAVAPHT